MTSGALADLLAWDNAVSFLIGVALTVLVWFLTRVGNVASRRTEASIERNWDRVSERRRRKSRERSESRARSAEAKDIERLRADRTGRLFRRRMAQSDPGMIGEVVDLHARQPKTHVVMVWNNPPGRESMEDDPVPGQRISIEWKVLNRTPEEQRHLTARLILKSHNDDDGWVEFEEIGD